MYREHTIGVVVPAYNEEGLVGDVLREMPEFVDQIYAIDDYSTDGTWEEILDAAESTRRPIVEDLEMPSEQAMTDGGAMVGSRASRLRSIGRVTAIRHRKNFGAGGAIKTGYLAALEDAIDITVTVDGDGQMDPLYMEKVLDPIVDGEADYAKGNRLVYSDYRRDMPKFRFIGNAILTFFTKIASGYWKTMDPQNGYTAISHYALNNVGISSLYEYYGYCNDLLVKLNAKGMRVADVAMPAIYGEEASSIRYPRYIWNVSWMLFANFLWRLKVKYLVLDFHPLVFFYMIGIVTSLTGVFAGTWTFYVWFFQSEALFVRGVLSMLLFMLGSMFLMFAMLFDMQVNEDKEMQYRE